jgi:hypothetical protein
VWIENGYIEAMRIESISPEPERVEAEDGRHIYVFPLAAPDRRSL